MSARRIRLGAPSLAVLTVLTACDPILSIDGVVRAAPPPCARESREVAVTPALSGVKMKVTCRGSGVLEAVSDEAGRFQSGTAGIADESCMVRFEKVGYVSREMRLVDLCRNEDGTPRPPGSGPCVGHAFVELETASRAPLR